MKTSSTILRALVAAVFVAGLCTAASANVWINEDFDGDVGPVWSEGDGVPGGSGDGTVDWYDDGDAPTVPATLPLITHTGDVITTKSFNGTSCWQMTAGQGISVADGYKNQGNGNTIYFQFALNVDPIPAAAGPIARWEYNTTLGSAYRFYLDIAANGTGGATVSAGQDLAAPTSGPTTIATLNSSADWVYLTVQLENDPSTTTNDPRSPVNPLTPGCRFYASSLSPAATVAIPGSVGKDGNGWSITVNAATTAVVFIDDLYWDGAMEGDNVDNPPQHQWLYSDLQMFNKVPGGPNTRASVTDWPLIK